jgi:hypothetical protein
MIYGDLTCPAQTKMAARLIMAKITNWSRYIFGERPTLSVKKALTGNMANMLCREK